MEIVDVHLLHQPQMLLVPLIIAGGSALHRGFTLEIGRIADPLEEQGIAASDINNLRSLDNILAGGGGSLDNTRGGCLPVITGGGKNKARLKDQPGRRNDRSKDLHTLSFRYFMALARILI